MANYKWPNVYPNIKDLSGVVATNSVTACAYVGEAEFGPINKPTFLSTLKDYTSLFGALNSAKYGYAGYSLAVASESIDSHYFVRVVKAGPNADTGEHEADDAKYSSVKLPKAGTTNVATTEGWYVEQIAAVEKEEKADGLFVESEYRVQKVEIVKAGKDYSVGSELTITLDKTPAKVKVTKLESEFKTTNITINDTVTGYINGEEIVIALDKENLIATAVVEGESDTLSALVITTPGLSSTEIKTPIEITSESGVTCSVSLTMENTGKIKQVEIIEAGKSTTSEITNPVTVSGGAQFNITLTNADLENALIFVADNPNNLKIGVKLTDSTINENRAYPFSKVQFAETGGKRIGTITGVQEEVLKDLTAGDSIAISRSNSAGQEGIFVVTTVDTQNKTICFDYNIEDGSMSPLVYGKVSKYPGLDERTFQVDVYLAQGKLEQTVETYQYCTLYQHKDNYGNSTFVEDVINGSSNYLKVYANNHLLNSLADGETLQVKLHDVESAPTYLAGGQSGGKPSSKELNAGWDQFKDRTQVTVSLLLNSGYTNGEETSYQNKMLEIAEHRRDCFCLFDIPMGKVEAEDAIDWRKNILGTASYRGALSSPWVRTYDSIQGRANFVMCPSAFLAKLIGQAGDPWHAPAGPNRGVLSSSTVSPTGLTQSYDSVIGGTLYADNQINCIVRDTGAGYVNWGQRTLQQKPSALDRINVARTVIYIETILRDAARWHLFENNTPYERMQITLQFSAFLDTILSADGIASYKVVCDSSNNTPIVIANNQLVIDVIITPVYAAESIILNTTITGADASVSVSSSAS